MKFNFETLEVFLSKKAFHYKFMSFILGDKMPNLNSLCPYFWLFWFCVLISPVALPIILLVKGLYKAINLIDRHILEPKYNKWRDSLTNKDIYLLDKGILSIPMRFKDNTGSYEIKQYIRDKFQIKRDKWGDYNREDWEKWQNILDMGEAEFYQLRSETEARRRLREEKRQELLNKVPRFTWPKYLTFSLPKINLSKIITWTKRVIAIMFTTGLSYLLYIGGTALYKWMLTVNWSLFFIHFISGFLHTSIVLLGIICIGLILYGFYRLILLLPSINNERFERICEIFVNICMFMWNIIVIIFKAIISPFKFCWQYFKATKNDYCPGIVWEDEK